MTKVSAVITTYGREVSILERAINSVLNQTFKNMEIILIDDNGLNTAKQKKNSKLIDEKYKDVLSYIPLEKNSGAQIARNMGIEVSKGDYLAFLDDDDIWYEDKIEKQLNAFRNSQNRNLGLVYCWYEKLKEEEEGKYKSMVIELPEYSEGEVLKQLARKNYVASTSFPLIKKSVFEEIGYFDENLEASQDYDMWIRIAQKFKIKCVNEPLAAYIVHKGERITRNNAKKARAEAYFLNKHYDLIKQDKLAMSVKNTSIGIYLMRLGRGKEARRHFRISIKYQPIGIRVYKYYVESYVLEMKEKNN